MSEIDSLPAGLRERARLVVETFETQFHVPMNYDEESIASIEVYLELIRELLTVENAEEFITSIGAYLGECLVRQCGGSWSNEPGWWSVRLADGVFASPFVQVRAQLQVGREQSVVRYFRCLSSLAKKLALLETDRSASDQQLGMRLMQEMNYWSTQIPGSAQQADFPLDARKAI